MVPDSPQWCQTDASSDSQHPNRERFFFSMFAATNSLKRLFCGGKTRQHDLTRATCGRRWQGFAHPGVDRQHAISQDFGMDGWTGFLMRYAIPNSALYPLFNIVCNVCFQLIYLVFVSPVICPPLSFDLSFTFSISSSPPLVSYRYLHIPIIPRPCKSSQQAFSFHFFLLVLLFSRFLFPFSLIFHFLPLPFHFPCT